MLAGLTSIGFASISLNRAMKRQNMARNFIMVNELVNLEIVFTVEIGLQIHNTKVIILELTTISF